MPDENQIPAPQEVASAPVEVIAAPPEKAPEQLAMEQRAKERAEAKAKEIAAAKALKEKHDALRLNIGKKFTDGQVTATVAAFEPNHCVRGTWGESFLINLGNPNRFDYVNAAEFLTIYKPKE